jgi:hypothetical protein
VTPHESRATVVLGGLSLGSVSGSGGCPSCGGVLAPDGGVVPCAEGAGPRWQGLSLVRRGLPLVRRVAVPCGGRLALGGGRLSLMRRELSLDGGVGPCAEGPVPVGEGCSSFEGASLMRRGLAPLAGGCPCVERGCPSIEGVGLIRTNLTSIARLVPYSPLPFFIFKTFGYMRVIFKYSVNPDSPSKPNKPVPFHAICCGGYLIGGPGEKEGFD